MKKNKNAVLILLNYGIVVALLLMIAIFSFTSKNFFRTSTMFTILKQVSITGIVCMVRQWLCSLEVLTCRLVLLQVYQL